MPGWFMGYTKSCFLLSLDDSRQARRELHAVPQTEDAAAGQSGIGPFEQNKETCGIRDW